MNILIGVPCPQVIPFEFVENILSLIFYSKENVKGLENLYYAAQSGVRTDRNRNIILEKALELNVDYILWLDADMLYPKDMIQKYLSTDFDVIGCLYFKHIPPYSPVAYVKGDNPKKPYLSINPDNLKIGTVYDIDGLGFGGMMVDMKVFKDLGDEKWMRYGSNYHIPFEIENHLTHDLEFCRMAQEKGFVISLHSGVQPGHVSSHVVTYNDWQRENRKRVQGFSVDWFSQHIENWNNHLLPLLPQNPHIIEIGSYEGRSTLWMLENIPGSSITAIDPFTGSGYLPHENLEEIFRNNIGKYIERVEVKKGFSNDILPTIKSQSVDMVYVDGAHDYKSVKEDATEAYRVSKPGGIIVFDDYLWQRFGDADCPKPAIDEFMKTYPVELIHKDKQVIVRKLK